MKVITFYSYKGGVGRSLALSNIANRLSEFGKKVCLIDFDLEAPGLHHKFKRNIDVNTIKNGLVDYIEYFLRTKKLPKSISNYVTKITFENENQTDIDLIASGKITDQNYWKKLSSINWNELFFQEDSEGIGFFLNMKDRIEEELNPDFLLVDSRTGITNISGITMSLLADEIVLLASKNEENIDGIKQIIHSISLPENNVLGKSPKIDFVLCRIPYFTKPEEKAKELEAKNQVKREIDLYLSTVNSVYQLDKIFVIHSDPELELEETLKIGYEQDKRKGEIDSPIAIDYLELFEEITKGELSQLEIQRFNNLKESEFMIKTALSKKDNLSKIEILKSAIELNPISDDAYFNIAVAYIDAKNYKKALHYIERAVELRPSNLDYALYLGVIYKNLDKVDRAEQLFLNILASNDKHYGAIFQLGLIHYYKKSYKTALPYFEKIIELFPDYFGGYNSVANTKKSMNKLDEAFKFIYKALELSPKDPTSHGTIAEIYARKGNHNEFYKNLELSFEFGMTKENFAKTLKDETAYNPYLKEKRFSYLLNKYNLNIDIANL